MNLFNCYQALAFYTIVPLAIQYLAVNGYTSWAIVMGVGEFIGFCVLGIAIHESTK